MDVSLEGQDIESILKTVCSQTGLEYLISGRQIAVWLEGGISPIDPDTSFAVSGKVADINGEPLIGASVFIKGTETGVVTDLDGRYSITAHHGDVLVFSYIGYQAKEMTASRKDTADIVLTPDSRLLDESVVVGYGVQKKINLTGAVDVVDSEELVGRSASNTSSLLVGIVPNLNVTQSNGRPGQGASLNIRGINSISSSTGPLVLVDGIEGNIDNVNPNDIESISVLKDASSSAVYGGSDGEKAIEAYRNLEADNIIANAPMLVNDYDPMGERFVDGSYTEEQLSQFDYEDYRRHQGVRHPRTVYALTEDNDLLLIAIDGRWPGKAEGMNAAEVTRFIVRYFNPQWAINMDGGGSTTLTIKGLGHPETNVVNYPTDGGTHDHTGERKVTTHLLVLCNEDAQ